MQPEKKPSSRRGAQFSLKAILMLTLIVAAYFAGKVPEQRRAREAQRLAEEQAQKAMMLEREARDMAQLAMERAQMAAVRAQAARNRLAAEIAKAKKKSKAQ